MPTPLTDVEMIQRLLLAAAVGGAIGAEREFRRKSAGFRTNILIALGSALFTILSRMLAEQTGGDSTRIAAQIVVGIGFLGAGAIIRTDRDVNGVTTAAVELKYGKLRLKTLSLAAPASKATVTLAGRDIPATLNKQENATLVTFANPMVLGAGEKLEVRLS